MDARFHSLMTRLNRFKKKEVPGNSIREVSLRSLFGEGEFFNRNLLPPESANAPVEPDQFPHAIRIITGLMNPILYYALNNSKSAFLTDNSVRDLASFSESETHGRHILNRLFRSYMHLGDMVINENLPTDIQKTYLEVQSGSDIDCRLEKPKESFYEDLKGYLLPKMAAALSFGHDTKQARDYVLWSQNPRRAIKGLSNNLLKEISAKRVDILDHNKYDLIISTSAPVLLMAQLGGSYSVMTADHDLYLTLRKIDIADGISVIKFSAGVFLDGKYDKDKMIYPLLAVDFQTVSKDNIAVRGGPSGSSYDRLIPMKRKIRGDELLDFYGQSTDVVGLVSNEDTQTLSNQIELGKDWEKIPDDGIKLQVATRIFWQAIEAELEKENPNPQISDETLNRIRVGISQMNLNNIPYHVKEMLRTDLLIAMFASPHRFAEYGKKSGIIDVFFPQLREKSYDQIVNDVNFVLSKYLKMKDYSSHEGYRQIIKNHRLARDGFVNGWQTYDELLNLKEKYPDKKSYLERIWLELTINRK